jgi:hypothetical protein
MKMVAIMILFILPPLFQLVYGSIATRSRVPYRLLRICLFSLSGLIVATILNIILMTSIINQSGSRDGLPIVGVISVEVMIAAGMVLMFLIQLFIKQRKKVN